MPSVKPNMPEEGFRHQVYGFNKDDVLAYVSALDSEAQQQKQQYEEEISRLKAQLDKLKQDQQNARACVERLQSDLLAQTSRADKAENDLAAVRKELSDCQDELKLSESHAVNYRERYQQSQKTLLEWQNKCRDLQQQLQDVRAAAAADAIDAAAEPEPAPLKEQSYFSAPPEDTEPAAEVVEQPPAQPEPGPELPENGPEPAQPEPPVSPAAPQAPAAPQPEPEPELPAEPEAPAAKDPEQEAPHQPDPSWWAAGEKSATVQARKILADARIYAQSTERRMRREAEEQKARMAGNARDLAAGVQLLRDRLSRVDEKLSAASIDLENATAAIYDALDNTDADLQALGVKLDAFANGTPELDPPPRPGPRTPVVPAPQPPQEPAAMAGQKRVRPVVRARQARPASPVRRLRSSDRRAVSQTLQDAINRLDGDTTQ